MAWRDNNIMLFASTISDLNKTVVRSRKRPRKNKIGAIQTRREFSNKYIKDLPIPKLINEYNYHIGGVDQFNQLKLYYNTLFPHRKTWRSLFHLMFNITLVNYYKLSTFSTRYQAQRSGHRKFLLTLVVKLQESYMKPIRHSEQRRLVTNINSGSTHELVTLFSSEKAKACVYCAAKGNRSVRRPLSEVKVTNGKASPNRPRRTPKGCRQCELSVCIACWQQHLDVVTRALETTHISSK